MHFELPFHGRQLLLAASLAALPGLLAAQTIGRVNPGDAALDCGAITRESASLDQAIAAGDPNANAAGRAVGGAAANVGGQIAGAALAQGLNSMLGSFGGLFSRSTGQVAQQVVQEQLKPSPEVMQRASEAQARKAFLLRLATARECRTDDPGFAGKPLAPGMFEQLAGLTPAGTAPVAGLVPGAPGAAPVSVGAPLNLASLQQALSEPVAPLAVSGLTDGKLDFKGKRFYVAEFRVLFEVGGSVSASTRAGYMPGGINYGATRATINYSMPKVDIAALQAITDKAYEDFTTRAFQAGVRLEDRNAFIRANGEVYPATENASRPGAPVYVDKDRKYIVMAPTGMKLHPRGFAGLGTGDMGKRMDFSRANLDALSISVAINLAALESSGNASSILQRSSSVNAQAGMQIVQPPESGLLQSHVGGGGLRMVRAVPVEGNFANFREVSGYNTANDTALQGLNLLGARMGVAANNSSTTSMEVDLDHVAMARMALRGLATVNQTVIDQIRAGQ